MEDWGLFNKTTGFYSSTLSIKGREWWGENGRVSWRGWRGEGMDGGGNRVGWREGIEWDGWRE